MLDDNTVPIEVLFEIRDIDNVILFISHCQQCSSAHKYQPLTSINPRIVWVCELASPWAHAIMHGPLLPQMRSYSKNNSMPTYPQ